MEHMQEIIDLVLKAISMLPDPPRESMRRELLKVKEMLMDSRSPRIAVLGRRGAGKSSVLNAIFGEKVASVGSVLSETGKAQWHAFKNDKGAIEILDTRGLGCYQTATSPRCNPAWDMLMVKGAMYASSPVSRRCRAGHGHGANGVRLRGCFSTVATTTPLQTEQLEA